MPITEKEAERILQQVQEGVERPKPSISFEIGEQVRVSDGPFASFNGVGRGSRRGAVAPQGGSVDLRPRNAGRTGIRSGREGLIVSGSLPAAPSGTGDGESAWEARAAPAGRQPAPRTATAGP
jgi:hypothetical protein